jgi:peptidoglycan-N-acetylglucosamine deacetylase
MTRFVFCLVANLLPVVASAASCPGNPEALGTERIMEVDAKTTPRVGRKQFPSTLPLHAKELVLTFDDGPWPGTTTKILDALKTECVHATFFLLGRNAAAHPQLVRRALAEGHTLGHHSYSHPLLSRMSLRRAEAEIDRGIAADQTAIYGSRRPAPATPFFRFPGFASAADESRPAAASGALAHRAGRTRHCALSRYQSADRPDVAGFPTRA